MHSFRTIAAFGLLLQACVANGTEDEPWESETDERGAQSEISSSPAFQLPFPCGQAWVGSTTSGHSPPLAVDFNRTDDLGDTVVAAASGRVARVENLGSDSYGRWIEINHGNGYTTRYAHLSVQSVHVGQQVVRGQKIGEVGNTGGSSGPHLHFEERKNGLTMHARFNGNGVFYFGSRTYTSNNCGAAPPPPSGGANGRIDTSGAPLTIRSGPGTSFKAIGSLADGTHVSIKCQQVGANVTGTFGTSKLWDKVGTGYVADAYVFTGADGRVAPDCK